MKSFVATLTLLAAIPCAAATVTLDFETVVDARGNVNPFFCSAPPGQVSPSTCYNNGLRVEAGPYPMGLNLRGGGGQRHLSLTRDPGSYAELFVLPAIDTPGLTIEIVQFDVLQPYAEAFESIGGVSAPPVGEWTTIIPTVPTNRIYGTSASPVSGIRIDIDNIVVNVVPLPATLLLFGPALLLLAAFRNPGAAG